MTEERLAPGKDVPAEWWKLFRSPELDRLVREALEASPTLARASAKLRQSQEDLSARQGGTQLPKVDAKLSANRIDVNPQSLGVQQLPINTPFNLYLASIGVSYTLDLFGANRRELEAL
ncbi:MAG TPA: TolC family protein, partial [Burkholderiales bacterium]|nr:TolC family protein [Burkholderiales bacterium]